MSLNGTFVLESNENYSEWLSAIGIPADNAARMAAAKPTLEVSQSGDNVTIKTIAGDKTFTNTIALGKDSKATLPGGVEYSVNMTLSGSSLKGTYSFMGKSGEASVEISGSSLVQKMTCGGVTAKRTYKRQ
ncbi:fatty acid-binding protein 2, liver-like [Macrobrachium nipponense]|uniref:Fatty acid binding protein 10 n=1 Tax=Macrobrachium nipponense TaxID=159736 RepID=H9BC94_MACNP|nr:fatty acid binding protein 10 [Macrobrachium nipponense]